MKQFKFNFKLMGLALLSTMAILTSSCSDDDGGGNNNTSSFVLVQSNLKGNINDGEVILESGKTYTLTGKLQVNNNAKLTIQAGAIIKATAVSSSSPELRYIAVAQGGQIFVNGTSTNPVVMTSDLQTPGAWGGLVICGKAPINKGATASAEVSDLTYGGTTSNDNSGSIKYLRIEYSGYAYNSEKEFNGLSLFGVGSGTTIEYVQVYNSSDDGFEWFGGTVNAKYLIVNQTSTDIVGDDLFDWTEGWVGTLENVYGIRTNGSNRGIEADNNSNNHNATPISNPTVKNITLIGSVTGGGENHGMKLRVGTRGIFDNVVLKNWGTGFDIQHDESIAAIGTTLKAPKVKFENVTTLSKGTSSAGSQVDVSAFFTLDNTATGAGNGSGVPTWATGWTVGL